MGQSSGFSHAQHRITRGTPYPSAAINLATGSAGATPYTAVIDSNAKEVALLGLNLIATAALGTPTTRAVIKVSVDPINGDANYDLQDEGLETPADFEFEIPEGVVAGQVLEFPLAHYRGSRDFAPVYPKLKAGDTVRVEVVTVGSGGTQTFLPQFIYRLLPDALDLRFYGALRGGEGQFIGPGKPYPFGGADGQAEGYPNYDKKIPAEGSPYAELYD